MADLFTRWKTLTSDNKRTLILAALFFTFAAVCLATLLFPSFDQYSHALAALMLPVLAVALVQIGRNARNQAALDSQIARIEGQVDAKRKETTAMLETLAHGNKSDQQP